MIETAAFPEIRFTYARLGVRAGAETPTHTAQGQIGLAFTAHPDLVYRVDERSIRSSVPPRSAYVTTESPIDWLEVRGPTEAIEMHVAPALLHSAGADRAPNALEVPDAVIVAAAATLRGQHRSGGVSDVAASTIAHRLALHVAGRYAGVSVPPRRSRRLSWREVDAVHDLVRGNPSGILTLEQLAQAVHRSTFDFARAFRDTTGMPPARFVTTVRMLHAAELLRSGATVTAAASAAGYASRAHFRQQFRSVVGASVGSAASEQERDRPPAATERMLER